jgi:hypothetical protein
MKRSPVILLPALALAIAACADVENPATPARLASGSASEERSASTGKQNAKVDLCHKTGGDGAFTLITIAAAAVDAHLAHGDGRIGGAVPGRPGLVFAADCRPEPSEPPPINLTLTPSVDGLIRDGAAGQPKDGIPDLVEALGLVQVLNAPPFEDRGIIEFDVSPLVRPVGHAELRLNVFGSNGPYPLTVNVFAYSGDGALTPGDFASGSPFTSLSFAGEAQVNVDVTSAVNALISSAAHYAAFNLRTPPSTISLNGRLLWPSVLLRSHLGQL